MTMPLLALCGCVWFLILIYHITHRGFLVLLIWLFIAPVAANIVNEPGTNPLFRKQQTEELAQLLSQSQRSQPLGYTTAPTTIKLRELVEPTRLLFMAFFGVFFLDIVLKKRTTSLDRIERWMLVFTVILLIGAGRSIRVVTSLRTVVDAFIVPFLAYCVSRRLVTSGERLHRVLQVVAYMGLYHIIIAVLERLMSGGLYYRLGTTFRNHHTLSFVMAIAFLLMLADLLGRIIRADDNSTFHRLGRSFTLWLAPVIVVLTWTRGNWVSFLLSTGVFLLLGRRLTNHARNLALIASTLIALSVIAVVLQTPMSRSVIEERVTERTGTVYARFGAWLLLLQESANAPVFGAGLSNTRELLGTSSITVMGVKSETHSHNSFLALFSELGAVGLLTYLVIVILVIRMGLQLYQAGRHTQERWGGVIVISSTAAYLIPALFANTLYLPTLSHIYFWGVIGSFAGLYGQRLSVPELAGYLRPPIHARKIHPEQVGGAPSYLYSPNSPAANRERYSSNLLQP
jgi:hypothetical protein